MPSFTKSVVETGLFILKFSHSDETCPFAAIRCDRYERCLETGTIRMYREDYCGQNVPPQFSLVAEISHYSYYDLEELDPTDIQGDCNVRLDPA